MRYDPFAIYVILNWRNVRFFFDDLFGPTGLLSRYASLMFRLSPFSMVCVSPLHDAFHGNNECQNLLLLILIPPDVILPFISIIFLILKGKKIL